MRPIPGTISGAPGCGLGESEGVVWSTCGQLDSLRCAQRTAGIVADVGDNRRQIGIRDAEPAGERRRILIDRQRRDEPTLADAIGAAVSQRRIDTVIPAALAAPAPPALPAPPPLSRAVL